MEKKWRMNAVYWQLVVRKKISSYVKNVYLPLRYRQIKKLNCRYFTFQLYIKTLKKTIEAASDSAKECASKLNAIKKQETWVQNVKKCASSFWNQYLNDREKIINLTVQWRSFIPNINLEQQKRAPCYSGHIRWLIRVNL